LFSAGIDPETMRLTVLRSTIELNRLLTSI
jgi:hypothetical protein